MKPETKTCQNCKSQFTIEPEDFDFYKKIKVPVPTWCPDCRYQRRLANRNEWNFYHRKCDLCKKKMVSIYNPSYKGPVYCQRCYRSDDWNPLDYGRDFDFSKSFFEQYKELRFIVPRVTLTHDKSVNSEYTNQAQNNKNCYMIVASNYAEDCLYGNWVRDSYQCVDVYNIEYCELLYESLHCTKCYGSTFLENCYDCISSHFLKDCRGCESCFGSVGLRNKSHCWFNEQLTKEEYQQRFDAFTWTNKNIRKMREKVNQYADAFPNKYYQGRRNVNSTGDYIEDTKNTLQAFNCKHSEDMSYCQDAWNAKVERDLTETAYTELDYEIEGCAYMGRSVIMSKSWNTSDAAYSELVFDSNNLFGCMSLHKKSYCILNKQYSKEEFQRLRTKIIEHMKQTGEWGEFFPVEISPFPYNDTVAQDYFPLTKEQILTKGWRWYDREGRDYDVTMLHEKLPATIGEVTDDILRQIVSCKSQDNREVAQKNFNCTTAFLITDAELKFYKKMGLPIPDRCFPCRLQDRLNRRNPRKLWHRQCMCDYKIYKNTSKHRHHPDGRCSNEFETSYAPDRKEIVYCGSCYQSEVV